MLFENVYNRMMKQDKFRYCENEAEFIKFMTSKYFEAGVKAALGESTQQPVLLKGKQK
jgi:hypothetical protein